MDTERFCCLIKDKVDDWGLRLSRVQIAALGVLLIVMVGAVYLYYARSRPAKVVVMPAAPVRETKGEAAKDPKEKIVVHVSGAVAKPGVYELPKGSRVYLAVDVAGQVLAEAQLDSVNLAAKLVDGQRVHIPKKGEVAANPAGAAGMTVAVGMTGAAGGEQDAGPIDLNTATAEQLDKLPGVGAVLAKRIVDYRASHGGFNSVNDLRQVDGIGERKFKGLKDKVRVE